MIDKFQAAAKAAKAAQQLGKLSQRAGPKTVSVAKIVGMGLLSGAVGAASAAIGAALAERVAPAQVFAGFLGAVGGTYIGLKAVHGAYSASHGAYNKDAKV